jgi:hypothetical protein
MEKQRKWPFLVMVGIVILLIGAMATVALAQTLTPEAEAPAETPAQEEDSAAADTRSFRLGRGGFGHFGGDSSRDEYLAEALGITVEELQAARQRAHAASIAAAVADGSITQEQADQLLAMHALRNAIDRQALLAEALGMTVDELEAALAGGQSLRDLMSEQGIDASTLQANVQAAYEAAVAQAVADGIITQAQADAILADGMGFGLFDHGRGHGRGGGRGFGRGGWRGLPDLTTPDTTTPETTDTRFDA